MEPHKLINDYDFLKFIIFLHSSLQLLAPGTKKFIIPLHPIIEVQSNGHQRYQKHYLKWRVLSRMNKKGRSF